MQRMQRRMALRRIMPRLQQRRRSRKNRMVPSAACYSTDERGTAAYKTPQQRTRRHDTCKLDHQYNRRATRRIYDPCQQSTSNCRLGGMGGSRINHGVTKSSMRSSVFEGKTMQQYSVPSSCSFHRRCSGSRPAQLH